MRKLNIKAVFIEFLRYGLRAHVVLHIFEFASAVYEEAYLTAALVTIFAMIQILASFLLPHEHIHVHKHGKVQSVRK